MRIFNISCKSSCGTYFGAYLQSVSVVAESKEEAIDLYEKWSKKNYSFEKEMYPKNLDISDLGDVQVGVFDYTYDSDY